jgi:HrpA-like RNA helicase
MSLPIDDFRNEILRSIETNRITCITGETGCGKSSMVPQFIVADSAGRGQRVHVIMTQPRRVAAVTLARRISRQIGSDLGSRVGYKIGSGDRSSTEKNLITVATAGYLLQHLARRPENIRKYTHLILDEVHERETDMDLLNLLIKKILQRERSKIRIILMSATLQAETISSYFSLDAVVPNIIHVGASPFEVSTIFLEDIASILPKSKHISSILSSTVDAFNLASKAGRLSAAKPQVILFSK